MHVVAVIMFFYLIAGLSLFFADPVSRLNFPTPDVRAAARKYLANLENPKKREASSMTAPYLILGVAMVMCLWCLVFAFRL
jgi:hypothetical protein